MRKYKPNNRKRLYASLAAAVVILLLAVGAWGVSHYHKASQQVKNTQATLPKTVNQRPSNSSDNAANDQRKENPSPSTTLDNGTSSSPSPTFSANIVSANVSNGNLHVGTMVTGATSGTCTLTASKSGQQSVSLISSKVIQDVNSYDCGIINIATSKFPSSESWKLTLTVTNGGSPATDSTNITIP